MLFRKGLIIIFSSFYLFGMSASQLQVIDKTTLGCIKGIGKKRLDAILKYREKNRITELNDLLNIQGIGKKIIRNIKEDIKKKSCLIDKQKPMSTSISKDKNGSRKGKRALGAK